MATPSHRSSSNPSETRLEKAAEEAPHPSATGRRAVGRRSEARAAEGRADQEDLLPLLRRSSGAALLALVEDNGARLGLRELRQVLLNPFVDGAVISALAANRKLCTAYEVRAALARHRRTPESVAMRWLSGLFWRDLSEITLDTRLRAAVRRVAQRYLVQRLPRLSQGEKIALARRSVAEVASRLLAQAEPRLTAAVLENPRLTEKALLAVVTRDSSPPRLLDVIARHERWGHRYEVRAALCRNASTPFRILLRHLESLHAEDLEIVAGLEAHAEFIRSWARELLDSRSEAFTIGLESANVRSSPPRAPTHSTRRRIVERFDLDPDERDGQSAPRRSVSPVVHEKEEKAYKL